MKKHLKRLAAPRTLAIPRKTNVWIVRSSPGPHALGMSIPLLLAVRDMLSFCDSGPEGRRLIGAGNFLVDGKVRKNAKHPLGLMDVLTVKKTGEHYRVMLDRRNKLRLISIPEDKAKWKLARIEGKTTVRGGKFQLNLHDGRNILLDKNKYKAGDVLKIELPSQKVLDSYPLAEGSYALLIRGSHVGELGTVQSYKVTRSSIGNLVAFKEGFASIHDAVFVVGVKGPEVPIPEIHVA